MSTIPDDIAAMVDLLVQNELLRIVPVRCGICDRGEKCWFHTPFHNQEHREHGNS